MSPVVIVLWHSLSQIPGTGGMLVVVNLGQMYLCWGLWVLWSEWRVYFCSCPGIFLEIVEGCYSLYDLRQIA